MKLYPDGPAAVDRLSFTRAIYQEEAGVPHLELSAGRIQYEDTGGSGPVLVFSHGLIMDGTLFPAAGCAATSAATHAVARAGVTCAPPANGSPASTARLS